MKERVSVKELLDGVDYLDLPVLARELSNVATYLKKDANQSKRDADIRSLEEAQRAALRGNRRKGTRTAWESE